MSLDSHYDAIVVGSGFGGSVTAYRLAEAGKRVLVLERGRPYPPGSFTRSPYRARESFWDPPRGLVGMYHYWSFKGIDALVSAGLGGGSLIYANVFIRKDENWFVAGGHVRRRLRVLAGQPRRPRSALRPRRADAQPAAVSVRARAVRLDAEDDRLQGGRRGQRPRVVPAPAGGDVRQQGPRRRCRARRSRRSSPNLHGRTRTTCQLCGECDVGCNYGSKNTLDYNYLTHAQHHGAEIRTLADVRRIGPRANGGGYEVMYADLGEHPENPVTYELTCDHLILSAGTLGTTNLLLRNRSAFPRLSRKLGSRFCGNGDLLTLALNTTRVTDGVKRAADRRPRLRPGDHLDRAHARRERPGRHRARLLPAGRGLPAAPGLDPARGLGAQAALALARGRELPGQELAPGLAGHRRHRPRSPT